MRFSPLRALLVTLCLTSGAGAIQAQQAAVVHAVSLRGDPSTHSAPIGHLRKGASVTLLDAAPAAGFYHVRLSDGTEGWVGKKYLTVAVGSSTPAQPTGSQPPTGGTPAADSTAGASSGSPQPAPSTDATCDPTLWDHVYNQQRLIVKQDCLAVTGTIVDATHGRKTDGVRHEADGDTHGWLKLDPGFENLLNAGNASDESGNLVFEIVCMFPVTQQDAAGTPGCQGYQSALQIPPVGSHVRLVGRYVQDTNHAKWNEIHPVTSITVIP